MDIQKRDGTKVPFNHQKISNAMEKAFRSVNQYVEKTELERMALGIQETIANKYPKDMLVTVEQIQDLVELTLIENKYYTVVRAYILYRASHATDRKVLDDFNAWISDEDILQVMRSIQEDFDRTRYPIESLYKKFKSFAKENRSQDEYLQVLTKSAAELTGKEAPDWEFIAGRFLTLDLDRKIEREEIKYDIVDFKSKIRFLAKHGLYGAYILEHYKDEALDELQAYLDPTRNHLLNYSAVELLSKRYIIKTHQGEPMERFQEMFMGIAMHLAMKEKEPVKWAKKFYDILSCQKVTVATPTMNNSRKPFHQLSSCFIDTVPDTLKGIYRSISNFAEVSKHGGGMGLYFGKVRANGSDIRGFKGVAGGVIRWIKLANDTAVAVDQLGVRQGSVACYLDIWHKDIPEFLQIRTNNGDDRQKAHDVFPALCVPDYFWTLCRDQIDASWTLFDPHEIMSKKGYCLEDFYGQAWQEKYLELVADPEISRRVISVKDLLRMIIKSWTETGTPFIFNRDTVNRANPNKHKGMIYCSNLCTEIMQNMSAIETKSREVVTEEGETVIVEKFIPGDFVVCNLASLVLGNLNLDDDEELEDVMNTVIRGLDNVIDLNFYPTPYAEVTNRRYRPIGLGVSGYHHALVKHGIRWSDRERHLEFADHYFEKINYYAIKASMNLAKEKGRYPYFEGSEWENGGYFRDRDYTDEKWQNLARDVAQEGLRNGYIMAIAPTASTSIIAGTSPGIDPIMNRYFLEEKKGSIVPRVAPELDSETFWLYETAHEIDQMITAEACGVRSRHIDQAQSMNFYITENFTMRQILNLYLKAWESGVKTVYYVRSKSLEVEECEVCQ